MSDERAAERHRRLTKLFAEAADRAPSDRSTFLEQACPDDPELRREVEDLLARADAELPLPEIPAVPDGEALAAEDAADAAPRLPRRIGRYRIVRHLGRGGMSEVYEAEQDHPRRSVAVKVLRSDMAGASLERRFQLEAHVLGQLRHPGIARIFEAGVARAELANGAETDVPYFAMEHVRGLPLLEHARRRGLAVAERIELMARVCDAVQHAHEHGVVHRDLKPDNVLVEDEATPAAGDRGETRIGQPKVLDFGVALAVGAGTLASTAHTVSGQLVGTLTYMSPEQAAGRVDEIDARSDVYSLGVVLYELLSGRLPYTLHGPSLADLARAIQEREPTRLGAIDPALRGDVETIVAVALAKEPLRRYASAAQMGADLRRVLRDEPILARAPGPLERSRKFVRRNRALVAGTAAAFAALAIGTVVSLEQAAEARHASRTSDRLAYRTSLAAAASALRSHQIAQARRLLDESPARLRGFEWAHLRSRLDESLARVDLPGDLPHLLAWRPDGSTLAIAGEKRLRLVAADGSRETASRELPFDRWRLASSLAFTRDGARLLVGGIFPDGVDPFVTVRDAVTLDEIERMPAPGNSSAFDESADRVACTFEDHLRVVDLGDRRVIRDVAWPVDNKVASIAYSAAADAFALSMQDAGGLDVRRAGDGSLLWRFQGGVNSIAFDRKGTRLLAGLYDPRALLVDAANGRVLTTFAGHEAGIADAAFSPDETSAATVSNDGTVRLWDVASGAGRAVFHGHEGRMRAVRFSPDGERLATVADDSTVRFWDARSRGDANVLPHPHTVYAVAFTPDGRRFVTGCLGGAGTLRVFDSATGELVAAWLDHPVTSLAIGADGRELLVGATQVETRRIDAATGERLSTAPYHDWTTEALAFDPARPRWASTGRDGTLRVVDSATGSLVRSVGLGGSPARASRRAIYAPDGSVLFATALSGPIEILDGESLETRGELTGHAAGVTALALDAQGTRLASGAADGEVRLWDVATRRCVAVLRGHEQETFALAFSPDGTRLASGGRDRTIRIWDLDSFEELLLLRGHTSFVYALAFSPDGAQLVSGGGDDTARIWSVRPLADVVRARAAREAALPAARAHVEALWRELGSAKAVVERLRNERDPELSLQVALGRAVGGAQ